MGLHELSELAALFGKFNTRYWINIHGLQLDEVQGGYRWQIEHVFRVDILPETFDERVYLGGFADHNIAHHEGTESTWLEEAQFGVRIYNDFYGVFEQRYNGFRTGAKSSFGLGVEYVHRF